jgi:hypothetical protein
METLSILLYHFFFVARPFWQLPESYRRKQKGRAIRANGDVLEGITEGDEVSPFFKFKEIAEVCISAMNVAFLNLRKVII